MIIKVAVLQYDVPYNTEESIQALEEMLAKAEWMGAKLVVAPETAIGNFKEVKEKSDNYLPRVKELVKKYQLYFSSSFYQNNKKKIFNQGYLFNPEGETVLEYKKIYPAKTEIDDGVSSGSKLDMADTPIGKVGMLICKDGFNRYSHFLYEKFYELQTDIVCIPTWSISWKEISTVEYIKHMFVYGSCLSRSYILVAGNTNRNTGSFGRSLIINPITGVIKEGSTDKKEILITDVDLNDVENARKFDSWWQPKKRLL